MATTFNRKARADLSRHRARTVLTILTLALAIGSVATLAVPGLIDRAMGDEVRATRLADVSLATDDLELPAGTIDRMRALPNVAAADARTLHATRATVEGGNEHTAMLWGLEVADQHVNVVRVETGEAPGPGEVLVDSGNTDAGEHARPGDTVTMTDAEGAPVTLEVSGTGHSLATSPTSSPDQSAKPVFYAGIDTVQGLAGGPVIDQVDLRLDDTSPAAAEATVEAARDVLRGATGGADPLTEPPAIRAPGEWPGRALVQQITSLFQVVTVLAFGSALFLVANTMNTLIVEQRGEIAVMRALGGRRRQIAGVIVRSALLLGVAGAVVGTAVGIGIASAMSGFFIDMFGATAGFAVDVPMVVASLVLGPVVAVLATVPGLRRGLRHPLASTLDDRGAATGFGGGRLDRFVSRTRLLPPAARLGVRNALRQKRRSAATVAQLTLAVAAALSLMAIGSSIRSTMDDVYAHLDYDVVVEANGGAAALDAAARSVVEQTPGVEAVSPVLVKEVQHGDASYVAVGLDGEGRYVPSLEAGRWFTTGEADASARIAVLGPAVARATASHVGDRLTLDTATGSLDVEVIGIDSANVNTGLAVFLPRTTLQQASGATVDASNELWVTVDGAGTSDAGRAAIDATALAVDDRLRDAGAAVDVERTYTLQAGERADVDAIIGVQRMMGLLIVAVSMLGLLNAITMSVIERAREIGVLRCLGARGRDIRRAFTAESLTLVGAGWLIGVPAGWLLLQGMRRIALSLTDMHIPSVFPLANTALVLAGTVALGLVALVLPRRRASRLRPAAALRYE